MGRASAADRPSAADAELIQQLKQQLVQSQKMSTLGALTSTIAHEFNNILTAVMNYATFALRGDDPKRMRKSLEKILGASERACTITTDILGYARDRADRITATSLCQLMDEALALIERELNKGGIRYTKHYDADATAEVNANQIQQVFLNLLINARQAMPVGGALSVRIDRDASSQLLRASIADTGSGIPQEHLDRIFEPFFTTKVAPTDTGRGGNGLGLSLCRDVVESHGGRIEVDSHLGEGTIFTVWLPASQAQATDPGRQRRSA